MKQIPLAASRRETTGKGPARQMRRDGIVPAVIYGAGKEPLKLAVETREMEKMLRQVSGASAFLALQINGEDARPVLLHEMQHDYLGKKIVHADFYEIKEGQEITVDVPVELTGKAKGIDDGGTISQGLYEVTLRGSIKDIPDSLELDISDLDVGENLQTDQLELPAGVVLASEESVMVVSCTKKAAILEEVEEGEEGEEGAAEEDAEESGE